MLDRWLLSAVDDRFDIFSSTVESFEWSLERDLERSFERVLERSRDFERSRHFELSLEPRLLEVSRDWLCDLLGLFDFRRFLESSLLLLLRLLLLSKAHNLFFQAGIKIWIDFVFRALFLRGRRSLPRDSRRVDSLREGVSRPLDESLDRRGVLFGISTRFGVASERSSFSSWRLWVSA